MTTKSKRKQWREQRKLLVEPKSEAIYFRCSKNEKEEILNRIESMKPSRTITEYILESVMFQSLNVYDLSFLENHTRAISQIGSNVNQMTRKLHTLKSSEDVCAEFNELSEMIDSIKNDLKNLETLNAAIWKKLEYSLREQRTVEYEGFDD